MTRFITRSGYGALHPSFEHAEEDGFAFQQLFFHKYLRTGIKYYNDLTTLMTAITSES